MKTESKIEFVRNQVGNALHVHRAAYANGESLRRILVEKRQNIATVLCEHSSPDPLHIPNGMQYSFILLRSPDFQEFIAAEAALAVLEASPVWQEAHALIQPLVDELTALEIQLAPEVLAAKAALEALDQPVKPRSKAKLELLEA